MTLDGTASRIERRAQGKALRKKCSRTAQGEWKPRSKSDDIIKFLEESDADRIVGLIPLKYRRMSVSPFTFFRGAAIIQARDLANASVSGITVQACGDCYLLNFAGYASPERKLVFDYSAAYADQAERDFEMFLAAIRSGRLPKEPAKDSDLEFVV